MMRSQVGSGDTHQPPNSGHWLVGWSSQELVTLSLQFRDWDVHKCLNADPTNHCQDDCKSLILYLYIFLLKGNKMSDLNQLNFFNLVYEGIAISEVRGSNLSKGYVYLKENFIFIKCSKEFKTMKKMRKVPTLKKENIHFCLTHFI